MASTPDTITTKPRIAIVFPGQGALAVGMTAELAETYPQIHDTFAESKPIKFQDDEKIHSRNHNDDFNLWCLFFQE